MAINLRCSKCAAEFKLGARKCPKCGDSLGTNRRYRVAVKLADGSIFKKTVRTLEDAQRLERKIMSADFEGEFLGKSQAKPLKEIWMLYLEWAKAHKVTWREDEKTWRNYVERSLADKPMSKIGPTEIEQVLSQMRNATTRYGQPYKPGTVHKAYKIVQRVYNWAIQRSYYKGKNPCDAIKFPSYDNRITNYLSKDEINRLLDVLANWENKRAALVVSYALFSGRRKAEILNLKWSDIDKEGWVVTYIGMNTKNRKTQSLPMTSLCQKIVMTAESFRDGEYIFANQFGKPYTASGFDTIWKRIKDRAGIKKRFHDLRHTFASYLASDGVDLYCLQTLLGHESISMTKRYAHLLDKALRNAVSRVEATFGSTDWVTD